MSAVASPQSSQAMTDPLMRRFRGSALFEDYNVVIEKLGEGTFGVVSKATSKRTGKVVALKKIIIHNEKDGFPITALREVKLLKMLSHPNILRLEEMAVQRQAVDEKGKTGKKRAVLYMVMPYLDHDLSGMLTNPDIKFSMAQIKCYMLQLLEGVRYLHDSHILHRDMKAANILISNHGILQIADFGLARHYDGIPPQPGQGCGHATRDYTSLVVTRWYRPPELLLVLKRYTPAIDMWGVGCIFGEMFERKPILEGKSDLDQCVRIFRLLGNPTEQSMPGWSELPGCEGTKTWETSSGDIDRRFGHRLGDKGLDLLRSLLRLDWRRRINAIDALQHEFFKTSPLPSRPEDLPRYDDSHELDSRRKGQDKRGALPPAPAGGTVGMGPDEQWGQNVPSYQNNYPPDRRNYSRERGMPPNDDRRNRPPPPALEGGRQPAWKTDRESRAPPPTNGHLPARPVDLPPRPDVPSRHPPARGAPDRDTYIPSYRDRDGGPPPRERDERLPPRERDDRAPPRERDDYRPPPRDYDRERPRNDDRYRGYDGARRTRSRSPARENEGARRERLQNRERDFYSDAYRR